MKKTIAALALCLFPASALAIPGSSPAQQAPPLPDDFFSLPEYLGQDTVPLSQKERKALNLSRDWSGRGPAPVLSQGGKLVYVHGASMPTILASPMQVCDVELEPGEEVNDVVVGDSARWMVDTGTSGDTTHLFIKPVDAGLETTAVVTTDRRVYHLRLVSQKSGHTPYVGFVYADSIKTRASGKSSKKAEKERKAHMAESPGVDMSGLNFGYEVKGKASWKPVRVFDDGRQTFIHLPPKISEMPVLLARRKGENVLVNYRSDNGNLVVDGLFDELALLLGVGRNREEVRIIRKER